MNDSRICDLCDPWQRFAPVGNWGWPQGPAAGGVVEWLMAPVLKTGEVKASVGSNPTLSVSGLKTGIPEGSRDVPPIPETHCPAVGFLLFGGPMASQQKPGKQKIVVV